jgi:hypothetical protein
MHDKLQALLTRLRFDGMAAALDAELERAEQEATAAPELLYRLLCAEAASQRRKSLATALSRRGCRGIGRSRASPSKSSQASTGGRSKRWPGSTS